MFTGGGRRARQKPSDAANKGKGALHEIMWSLGNLGVSVVIGWDALCDRDLFGVQEYTRLASNSELSATSLFKRVDWNADWTLALHIVQNTKKKDSSPLQELELKNLLCISQPDLIIVVGNGFCMTGILVMEVGGFETVQEYKENGKWESWSTTKSLADLWSLEAAHGQYNDMVLRGTGKARHKG